jgi:hypothetical protein
LKLNSIDRKLQKGEKMNIRTCLIFSCLGVLLMGCANTQMMPPLAVVNCAEAAPANACARGPVPHIVTFDIDANGMPSNLLPDQLPNVCVKDSIAWHANGVGAATFPFNIIFVGDNAPMVPARLVTASSGGVLTVATPLKAPGNPNDRECLIYSVFVKAANGMPGGVLDPVVILER